MTKLSRREFGLGFAGLAIAAIGAGSGLLAGAGKAFAATAEVEAAIKAVAGGATPQDDGRITIDMPEIAENGNTVPVRVSVDSPMSADNYVKSVTLLADGNPNPGVGSFNFSPKSGVAEASTRMRLAKTQNVIAVAVMSDGSASIAQTTVKVTIGGCGG